ncbi:reverse transcriptase domain-containing protein [Tanacetum coccineum]
MAEEDEDKTAFFTGEGVNCYRKMPFGLKNAGATYQRLVDNVFNNQIRRNLEAYVDDMLNPKKCSFGVEEGPFLGHIITKQGIRANPSKVKAITVIEQPKMLKDIQSLNKKLSALSRFLSKGAKRSLPFLKVLKSCTDKKNIQWIQEAAAALQEMKKFVEILPTLTASIHEEVLMMYLAASTKSIKAALFTKREKGQQEGCEDLFRHIRDDSNKETSKDFLIEAPPEDNRKEVERRTDTKLEDTKISYEWKLYTNRASSSNGSGARLMLIDPKVLVEVLVRRSIKEKEVLQVETKEEESWMTPIHEYLLSGLLPEDPKESRKIRIKAPQYKLIKGSCSFNTEPRSMVARITKQGYYWPSMHRDVSRVIQYCEKCKEQSAVKKRAEIGAIASKNAWPFSHWGVNILGPLSTAPGGLKFLAVAIEHSTKWIEAKPLTTVSARHVERFVWEYVVCSFEVPQIISLKDDKHFKEGIFADLFESIIVKDGRGRTKEMTKRKESKEVALIEKAYYQNELRSFEDRIKESDSKSSKSSNIMGDYVPRGSLPSRLA